MINKNIFRRKFWRNVIFRHGDHEEHIDKSTQDFCALEAFNYALRGEISDNIPCGTRRSMVCLMAVNDWRGWKSAKERTEFLKPWVQRYALLSDDPRVDNRNIYATIDYVVRKIDGFTDCPQIIDKETAHNIVCEYQVNPDIHDAIDYVNRQWHGVAASSVISACQQGQRNVKKHMFAVLEILTR